MPHRRLAFAVRVGQPRATINAAWRRLLPVPARRRYDGPGLPGSGPAGRCLMTPAVPNPPLSPRSSPSVRRPFYIGLSYRDRMQGSSAAARE